MTRPEHIYRARFFLASSFFIIFFLRFRPYGSLSLSSYIIMVVYKKGRTGKRLVLLFTNRKWVQQAFPLFFGSLSGRSGSAKAVFSHAAAPRRGILWRPHRGMTRRHVSLSSRVAKHGIKIS